MTTQWQLIKIIIIIIIIIIIPVKAFVRGVKFQSVWNLLVFQVFKWLDKIYEKYLKRSSSVKTKPSSSGLKAPFIKLESVSR